MSYFIAAHTSIDKKNETITFTGWDNNVVPRTRYKCSPFSFKNALIDLVGRSIQFGTNNDIHLFLEETVLKIDEEFGRKPHHKYENDTEWLWDYLCWYSIKTPELDIKAEKAIEDFRQACLNYVPDKDIYILRHKNGKMVSKSSNARIYLTYSVSHAKQFKWFRIANSCFATKATYGYVPVLYKS